MSITNSALITQALREINVLNEVQSASAEQGAQALEKLNQLMEFWKEDDIDLGYFGQTDTTATCPIPDWAELPVMMALALRCAPQYGASISQETASVISSTVNSLKRKLIKEKMTGVDMSHMPIGQGHFGRGYDINKQ